jgi:hypothetical protein
MISCRKAVLLIALLITATSIMAQEQQGKTAAVTECIMLDLSSYTNANNTPAASVFSYFTNEQQRHLLDTILFHLSKRYSLTNITVYQKDSIAFTNSSMKGIGKFRKNDWDAVSGKKYDYHIKIYSDYNVSNVTIAGAGLKNTAQAKLSLYIAVFDAEGKRVWFPDAVTKDGISFGNSTDPGNYYGTNKEKADAYLQLFERALGKIFK